ncbi:MAG TPA: Na+/H+ antiporter NhaA [Polyangiaceae bacterium]|nr:Na+/H+ antiporter NhaA [Polyangiaceae bacterium]
MPRPAPPLPRLLFAFVAPFREFLRTQSASGLLLVLATAAALAWANSRFGGSYHDFVHARVSAGLGPGQVAWPLSHWVNDALMAFFFLLAGMEIKRELVVGELRTLRRAALPLVAALGGMAAPALIYVAFNAGGPGMAGWAVPTATDIAFSLGCLTLIGRRAPPSLGVFLAALAIFDDLGAIIVIALFYGAGLDLAALGVAAAISLLLVALGRSGVRTLWLYLPLGTALWVALYRSGLHATLAGVVLGLAIPSKPPREPTDVIDDLGRAVDALHRARAGEAEGGGVDGAVAALERHLESMQSPLDRLRHGLHGPVSYGIVPLFALVNAGITFGPGAAALAASPVALGAGLGLFVGKPVGVFGSTYAAVRLGLAPRPAGTSWAQIFGAALLAGIGFTMSIFITGLAFAADPAAQDAAKTGVFAGSFAGALAGLALLRRSAAPAPEAGDGGEVRVLVDLPQFANDYRLAQWAPRRALVGRTLGELDARSRYGVNVLGVWAHEGGGVVEATRKLKPVGGDYRVELGDTLLLVGDRDAVAAFLALDEAEPEKARADVIS